MGPNGLSERSVLCVRVTLRVGLGTAVRDDLLPRNVTTLGRLPTPTEAETRVLTPAEAGTLLATAKTDGLHRALVLLTVVGMRRSEGLPLRWRAVAFAAGVLRVRQGPHRWARAAQLPASTTQRPARTPPLPNLCAEALLRHRQAMAAERDAYRHPWPVSDLVLVATTGAPVGPGNISP